MTKENNPNLMTFGGHLEVLRRMLFRIIAVAGTLSVIVFLCKETTWKMLLAPSEYDFTTYQLIENSFRHLVYNSISRNFM